MDTIFGATSVQLAPEHPLVKSLAADDAGLREQVAKLLDEQKKAREAGDIGEIEKHGIPTGKFAINPYSGEMVPIWVANYVLSDYGTGAIMSVPGHDERDFEFAKKYAIPVRRVIAPADPERRRAGVAVSVGRWRAGEFGRVQWAELSRKRRRNSRRLPRARASAKRRLRSV